MRDRGPKRNRKLKPKKTTRKPRRNPLSFGFIFSIFRIMSLVGFVMILSAGFVFCHDIILQLSYFRIKNVDVTGMTRITRDYVLEKTEIKPGKNIFAVNEPKAKKLLESVAWIESAQVIKKLPGEIGITVNERMPLALIDFDEFYIVDSKGNIFKKFEDGDPDSLPIISGIAYQDTIDPGSEGSYLWKDILAILEKGAEAEAVIPSAKIKRITIDYQMGITISMKDGPLIKMGSKDLDKKLERISKILHDKSNKIDYSTIESINLQNINRIIVGFKKQTPAGADGKEV